MSSIDYCPDLRPRWRVRTLYMPDRKPSIRHLKLQKAFPAQSKKLTGYFETLDAIVSSIGTEVQPSSWAITQAKEILQRLEHGNLEPIKITPAAEGGIAICFANHDKYSDIESLNSGEILGVISNRRDHPDVWEIEPTAAGYASAIARIRAFLTSAEPHDAAGSSR